MFTLVVFILACWEWSQFCRFSVFRSRVYLAISILLCVVIFLTYHLGQLCGVRFASLALVGFAVAVVFWLLVVPVWIVRQWRPVNSLWIALAGWAVLVPTFLALLFLRDVSPWLLLTFAAIVWIADIAAYFVGRRFGKNKLAPAISPGKTIEGALGGIVGVALYFFAWQFLLANSYLGLHAWAQNLRADEVVLFGFFVLLAVASIMGDLFESWMKRGAGMKDSSNLLPGHGGILDRIDALTSTLPIAGLFVLLQAMVCP